MFNIKSLTDGEILLLMARRSGKSNAEIAQLLDIHPNHLSKLFKSETAVEVSDEKMSFLSAYVRFRVGGDWIEIEIGRDYKTCMEVYALLVERMG